MTAARKTKENGRNKGFEQTHREMIATAVRLVSEKGADAMSIAAMAREMGISRANVYYHFESREALLTAVRDWAAEQTARGMDPSWSVLDRTLGICRLVVEKPELMKLWINDFIGGDDIRQSYPMWDQLVKGMQERFDEQQPEEAIDAEVYCTIMLTTAFIAPRIYAKSVRPDEPTEHVVARFVKEQRRVLERDGLDWDE